MPRIDAKNKKNVFFFKDAVYAFGSIEDYSKKLMEVCSSKEEFFIMLSEQIYVESKIIDRKFDSVQKSIKFFALSFIFVIMIIIFWSITV